LHSDATGASFLSPYVDPQFRAAEHMSATCPQLSDREPRFGQRPRIDAGRSAASTPADRIEFHDFHVQITGAQSTRRLSDPIGERS
jgi:hypothetical protein